MKRTRNRRGATLLYVVVTGAGVATVLSGLTGFTAEVSRREGLNEEKAAAISALDGLQEIVRREVRSMAYGDVEVDGFTKDVETNDAADTASAMPASNDAIRGIAGFVGSVSEAIPTNMIVPTGMTLQLSTESINAFVEGSEDQGKRSEKKTLAIEAADAAISGATVASLGSEGLTYSYTRTTVIGVPYTETEKISRLAASYYYMEGGASSHVDSAAGVAGLGTVSKGMVEISLGARGYPAATEYARTSALVPIKVGGFDPQSRELLWWKSGYTYGRKITKEFDRVDSFPVNWTNQTVDGSTVPVPRFRTIHWSGSFNLATSADIQGATIRVTTNGDTWVYINGKLAMDMGGLKSTLASSEVDTRWMQTGANRIDIFYASRSNAYDFALNSNLLFVPETPTKIVRDPKFDKGWSVLTPTFNSMTGVQVSDGKGAVDSDGVDIANEYSAAPAISGVSYNAKTVSGDNGARFTQMSATLLIEKSAWDVELNRVISVFQRASATDEWRLVPWYHTDIMDMDPYRRVTITTTESLLKEPNLMILFDGVKLAGRPKGVFRIADVSMVTTTLSSAPYLFVPKYEEQAAGYAVVARDHIEVKREVSINGSVWGGHDLVVDGAPFNLTNNLWLAGEVKRKGLLSLAILSILGQSKSANEPPKFVLDRNTYQSRANIVTSGGTTSVLNPPAGYSSVNLYSSSNLTLSNLSIPSGGTIYVRGDLTIIGGITMPAGKELILIVDGKVKFESPILVSTPVTVSGVHVIAGNDVEVKRPLNWTGSLRTNDKVKFEAKTTITYSAPTMLPPGVAASPE